MRVSLPIARHAIASAYLADGNHEWNAIPRRVGSIVLQQHQVDAITRIRAAMSEFGGALLCDPVGTGKTFTALALGLDYRSVLVVAPAVLEPMWIAASARAGVAVTFASHESLSRGKFPGCTFDLTIVDEAHHARNSATRRFRAIARLASASDVLLLTATPIHNRRGDLDALLSLFIGSRASELSDTELGRCVLRRDVELDPAHFRLPRVEPLVWLSVPRDEGIVASLLALPPPLPPRGAGDGGALIVASLVRQWASSDAALLGGLIRRRNRAIALIAALESGTYPSRSELAAWAASEDSVQLAFAELVASPTADSAGMLAAINAHHDAICRIIGRLRSRSEQDAARAAAIAAIRNRHSPMPVVAFSQYADTVAAMFHRLARDGHVALLTGRGALVAGGRITRAEAIGRFAPGACGRSGVSHSEAITLLLTTDLLSEGVNLQDAKTVIHIDLPWTPARIEQRLGRIARMGSAHERVHSYAIHPPASAESVVRIERILESKIRAASGITGELRALTGFRAGSGRIRGRTAIVEGMRGHLSAWVDPDCDALPALRGSAAAVYATEGGFLGACRRDGRVVLVCSLGGRISESLHDLERCVRLVDKSESEAVEADCSAAIGALDTYLAASSALSGISETATKSRKRVLERISSVAARARPHARIRIADRARAARQAIDARLGIHKEHQLDEFAALDLSDDAWLDAVIELCGRGTGPVVSGGAHIIAIIVLVPNQANALTRARER